MTRRRIPTTELQAEERALHEDFKRLTQLSASRPLAAPLSAALRSEAHQGVEATCTELSNETIGLLVPADSQPSVGEVIDLVSLRSDDGVLMRDLSCEVTSVSPAATSEDTNTVFVTARFRQCDQKPTPALRITNPVRVQAVLEAASRSGSAFVLSSVAGSQSRERVSGVVVGDSVYLTTPDAKRWQLEQVISLGCTYDGRALSGFAKVRRGLGEALVLACPQALVEERGGIELRSLTFHELGSMSFASPVTGLRCTRKVLELSTSGLQFKADTFDVLPPGLRLRQLALSLGPVHLHADAIVTGPDRLEFTRLESRQELLEVLLAARVEGVRCATQVRHAAIRRFFRDEGVGFRDHQEVPRSPLGTGAQGLGKSLALVRDGELIAHGGGLRIYSRTWLAQHLLVKSGMHRAGTLSQQLMALSFEYGEALADIDFVRGLFKVTQGSPERIFSVVSERVLRPGLGYRARFEPMRIGAGASLQRTLEVREAAPDDEREFLARLSSSEDPLKLASDDLVPGELRLNALGRRYQAQGLARGRSLFVVQDEHGEPLGWSLVETMSPGLCWSELFGSFRLFLKDPSGSLATEARTSLAAHAVELARREGRAESECHAAPGDVNALAALGFASLGQVYEFGAHRSVVPELTQALGAVLSRLRRRELRHGGDEALALQNC
jgi:hypothetical protein